MPSFVSRTLKVILPVLILLAGFGMMKTMVASRKMPVTVSPENPGILVEAISVQKQDHPVTLTTTGTIRPAETATLIPEVSGRIWWVHPDFEEGGFLKKDTVLFRIDATDYRLKLMTAQAELARAEALLLEEEGMAEVAISDWKLSHPGIAPPSPLIFHEPQLRQAKAAVASAKAVVSRNRRDIGRCTIKAPFALRVVAESVAPGQYVSPGQAVANIAATDHTDLIATLPPSDLPWLDLPRPGVHGTTPVTIVVPDAGPIEREGHLLRVLGSVDPKGRMMRILIRIPDPFGLQTAVAPLSDGQFAEIRIPGKTAFGVREIPAAALRENDTIWLVTPEKTLSIRHVRVIRREKERVLIKDPLVPEAPLVVSAISGAAEGMKLRISPYVSGPETDATASDKGRL